MLDRIQELTKIVNSKLENKSYLASLSKHITEPAKQLSIDLSYNKRKLNTPLFNDEQEKQKLLSDNKKLVVTAFKHYQHLLIVACTYNMLDELKELLKSAEFFKNIVQLYDQYEEMIYFSERKLVDLPLSFESGQYPMSTLLGLAAFHGHLNIVKYLVEEQKADVNATDLESAHPLHHVVLGDSHPIHRYSYGTQHADVAQYLINHRADLMPYCARYPSPIELADKAKLPLVSLFSSNPVRERYFADTVRPIIRTAIQKQKKIEIDGVLSKYNR